MIFIFIKKMRKLAAGVLCIATICSWGMGAQALDIEEPAISQDYTVIAPCYVNITTTGATLSISGGTATVSANITANRGTTNKVYISMTLQKKSSSGSWSDVTAWSSTYNTYTGKLSKTYSVAKGTYRVKATYIAYTTSGSESTTGYSAEKTY